VTGSYQGADATVAAIAARLGAPVVPAGSTAATSSAPLGETLRRRPVLVRFGPPVDFAGREAAEAIDAAIRALLDHDPQPWTSPPPPPPPGPPAVAVPRLPSRRRVAPGRPGLQPLRRRLGTGARWLPRWPGRAHHARRPGPHPTGRALPPVELPATAECEPSMWGPPRPLEPRGRALLRVDAHGLRFGGWRSRRGRSAQSDERADTLQVGTAEAMWHFRPEGGSVFRLQWMLEAGRGPRRVAAARPPRPPW